MEASFKIVIDAYLTWYKACENNGKAESHSEQVDTLPLYAIYTKKLSAYAELFDMTYEQVQNRVFDAADSISPINDQPYTTRFSGAINA